MTPDNLVFAGRSPGGEGLGRTLRVSAVAAVETILLTMMIYRGVRVGFQVFRVVGSSMHPTCRHGQSVLVNRSAYRWGRSPHRGDIVVFDSPSAGNHPSIKRVIGLPGEKIEVRQGTVYRNDDALSEP
jgi:signal peptidase I